MSKNVQKTQQLVFLSVLIALQIVLSRFASFNAWNTRIGLGFIPVALAGIFTGPVSAAAVAALSDFLGAMLFPTGPYFPGFTLTAALTGISFGLFLHKKLNIPRILGAIVVNQIFLSLLMNTFWISTVYGSPFRGLLYTRFLQLLVVAPIQFILLSVFSTFMEKVHLRQLLWGKA